MTVYSVANWQNIPSETVVEDTAVNIQSALSSLTNGYYLDEIIVSNGPTNEVTVTVAQLTSDAAALALLVNPNGSAASIIVSDTAANIAAGFATIGTDSQISSIVVSNNTAVALTAVQVGNNLLAVEKLINANATAAQATVKDTAANIVSYLSQIQAAGSTITTVTVSNNTQLTLTAAQAATDATALAKVKYNNGTTTGLFKISDTAADISTYIDALNSSSLLSNITAITISDNASLTLTAAQLAADTSVLAKLVKANSSAYTVTINDTASDISNALDTLSGNSHLTSIVVSDNAAIRVSIAQITSDSAALAFAVNANNSAYTLLVVDDYDDIASNLAALNSNSHIAKVVNATDVFNLYAVSELTTYSTLFAKLYESDGTTRQQFVIYDTAANIQAALDSLQNDTQVVQLWVTDSATNEITVTDAQVTRDSRILGSLIAADEYYATIKVEDTGANLSYGALNSLNHDTQVDGIIVSSGTVALTAAEVLADTTALGELVTTQGSQALVNVEDTAANISADLVTLATNADVDDIIVTSGEVAVTASAAINNSSYLAKLYTTNNTLASVNVTDTAANISQYFDQLNSDTRVNEITISGGGALALTVSQAVNDTTALGEIQNSTYSITVTDSSADVQNNLTALLNNSHVTAIYLTDAGPISLTYSQMLAYSAVLGEIQSPFDLSLSDVTAANALHAQDYLSGSISANGTVSAISISDTSANVAQTLDELSGISAITSITLTDPSPRLSLTASDFFNNIATLELITNSVALNVSGATVDQAFDFPSDLGDFAVGSTLTITVSDTAANIAAEATALNSNSDITSIVVSDTAADVATYLDTLNGVTKLTAIDLSDSSPVLAISASSFLNDQRALALITNHGVTFDMTVTASQAAEIEGDFYAMANGWFHLSQAVVDTAANISMYAHEFGELSTISSITVSDTGANFINNLSGLTAVNNLTAVDVTGGDFTVDAATFLSAQSVLAVTTFSTATILSVNAGADQVSGLTSEFGGLTMSGANASLRIYVNDTAADVAQYGSDWSANSYVYSVEVYDTAANIAASLDGLNGVAAANGNPIVIELSDFDDALALTSAQFLNGETALSEIINDSFTIDVTGGVGDVLNVDFGYSTLSNYEKATLTIAVVDTAANVAIGADILNNVPYVTSVTVDDTADNISAYMDGFTELAKPLTINITGSSTVLSLTESAFVNELAVLKDIQNSAFTIDVTGVAVSQIATVEAGYAGLTNKAAATLNIEVTGSASAIAGNVSSLNSDSAIASVTVSDAASDLATYLDTLNGVTKPLTITLTNGGTPVLDISEASFVNDLAALADITNSNLQIDIAGGVTVAQVATVTADFASLGYTGTQGLSFVVNDGAANLLADKAALNANPYISGVTVTDYSGNIEANLGDLTQLNRLDSIVITNSSTLILTEAQFVGGFSALDFVSSALGNNGDFSVDVSATASQVAAVADDYAQVSNTKLTGFSISVSDSAANVAANVDTLNTDSAYIGAIVIIDTAANVATYIDELKNLSVPDVQIILSDTATLTLTEAQFVNDLSTLNDIANLSSIDVTGVTVAELSRVESAFSGLANASNLGLSISVVDSALNIAIANSNSELNPDSDPTSVTVDDYAANIGTYLTSLAGVTGLTAINLIPAGNWTISVFGGDFVAGERALGLIKTSGYTIGVYQATVAEAIAAIDAFPSFANFGQIGLTISVYDSAANLTADAATLAGSSYVLTASVHDTAANVATYFDALDQFSATGKLGGIFLIQSSPLTISLSEAAFAADYGVLSYIQSASPWTVAVSGVTVSELSTVESDFTSFYNSDGSLSVSISDTAANILSDAGALSSDSQVGSVSVVDTAENVAANLDALTAIAKLGSITLTDQSPVLTISAASALDDLVALQDITNSSYTIDVTGATAAQALTIYDDLHGSLQGNPTVSIAVVDNALDIENEVSQLNSDPYITSITVNATAGDVSTYLGLLDEAIELTAIHLTDANPVIETTQASFLSDLIALSTITNSSFGINVNSAFAAEVANIESQFADLSNAGHATLTITVLDVASDIEGDLSALSSDAHVTAISVYGDGTISLSASQAVSDAAGIAKLTTDGGSDPYSLVVNDTAANLSANFNALNNETNITSIVVSDDGALALTVAQLSDTFAIGLLANANGSGATIDIVDTAANVANDADALSFDRNVASISVVDTAANVSANFYGLGVVSTFSTMSITLTDPSPVLTLSGEVALNYAEYLLPDITNASFAIDITNVTIQQMATAFGYFNGYLTANPGVTVSSISIVDSGGDIGSDSADLSVIPDVTSVTVDDSAYNVSSNLDAINGVAALTAINLSDANPVIEVAYGTFVDDLRALSKITNSSFGIEVDAVPASDIGTIETDFANLSNASHATLTIAIEDTAANIATNFGAIEQLWEAGELGGISLSQSAPTTINLTEAAFAADYSVLASVNSAAAWTVAVSGVTVSELATVESDFASLDSSNGSLSVSITDTAANVANDFDNLFLNSTVAAIDVVDTAANVAANFRTLGALASVGAMSITLTDPSPVLTLSGETAVDYIATIGDITNASYALDIIDATASDAEFISGNLQGYFPDFDLLSISVVGSAGDIASDVAELNDLPRVTSVTVNDSAYDVSSNLASLNNVDALTAINLSDSDPVFEMTSSTFLDGLNALSKITNSSFGIEVTGAAVDILPVVETYFADLSNAANATLTIAADDTAANIQTYFQALSFDTQVTSIEVSDAGTITLSIAQAASDARGIAKLTNNGGANPYSLAIEDTAANLAANLDALNGDSKITSIVVSDDDALTLSVSQLGDTFAIGLLVNADGSGATIDIVDTAAHISTSLSTLEASQNLSSITISDNASITVSTSQLENDQDAIALLQNQNGQPITLIVEDTAANIQANAAMLGQDSQISSVIISDNAALTLTVAQANADASLFAILSNANSSGYTVDVKDNATNLSSALDALNSNSHVSKIIVIGNAALTVTAAQITSDATALSKVYNAADTTTSTYTLSVVDTAADISAAFASLNGNSRVTKITISDSGTVTLSASVAVADTTAEAELYATGGVTRASVAVSDTAANISAVFAQLNSNANISAITIASGGALTLTAAQATADTTALGKIQGSYSINVTDTAANIATYINALRVAANISTITLTNSSTPTIAVTQFSFTSNVSALAKIASNYNLSITNTTVAELYDTVTAMASLPSNASAKIAVSDSAANVTSGIATLEADVAQIGSIALTDSGTPTITLAEYKVVADYAALDKITGTYNLAVASVTAAQMTTVQTDVAGLAAGASVKMAIVDTAANVQGWINTLEADVAQIGSVTLTDSGTPTITLTETKAAADAAVLDKIAGSYNLSVTTVTVAELPAIETAIAGLPVGASAKLLVTDSAYNVQTGLTALEAEVSAISSITLTNTSTPTITVTEAAFVADYAALDKVVGTYNLAITGVTSAQAATVQADMAGLGSGAVASFTVSDTEANVSTYLSALHADAKLSSITLTNPSATMSVADASFNSNVSVLNKISSAYNLSVTGVTTSLLYNTEIAFATLSSNVTAKFAVSDTSANIAAGVATLQTDLAQIGSIALTGTGTQTVSLAEWKVVADYAALDKITGTYNLAVTGVTAAQVTTVQTDLVGIGSGASVKMAISDTAANIQGWVGTLESDVAQIGSIALTDSGTPTITLTEAKFVADAAVMDLITGSFNLAVTGVTVATLSAAQSAMTGLPVGAATTLQISDSAFDVQTGLTALESGLSAISSITLTNTTTPTITVTEAAFVADLGALDKIGGTYNLAITGVTSAQISTVEADLSGLAAGASPSIAVAAGFANASTLSVSKGLLDLQGAITGTGGFSIGTGATLELDGAVASTQTITLGSTGGAVLLNDLTGTTQPFQGSISGITGNNQQMIELGGAFASGTTFTFTENSGHTAGTLALTNGSSHASLTLNGNLVAADFQIAASGGIDVITYSLN